MTLWPLLQNTNNLVLIIDNPNAPNPLAVDLI